MLAKRLMDIVTILEEEGMTTVSSLAQRCNVTEKTIRLDLNKLAQMNIVNKVHGGAILANNTDEIFPVVTRKQKHVPEKHQIAQKAREMIQDGDTIFLDAGTTTLELARCIDQNVIVITNDALIAAELITHKSVTLYCTGGQLQRGNNSYVYVGPDAMQSIAKYRTSKCLIGCSALNFEYGLMVFSGIEAEIKKEIAKSAESIICLADSSKFNRTAFSSYLRVEEIDVCITDDNVAPEHVELLKQKGVQVIVAGEND